MSLYIDPAVQTDFDEPPYSDKREPLLYAPSAPFGEAITAWLDYQHQQMGVTIVDPRHHKRSDYNLITRGLANLEQLAELCEMTSRALRRYMTGESKYIELNHADRVAIALDIPLVLLAEDFKTMPTWLGWKPGTRKPAV